jgi:hypothetical protein
VQTIEQDQNSLILHFQRSIVQGLLIATSFVLVGLFFCLLGLVLIQHAEGNGVLPVGIGSVLIVGGIFFGIKFPRKTTVIFDRDKNHVLFERWIFFASAEYSIDGNSAELNYRSDDR